MLAALKETFKIVLSKLRDEPLLRPGGFEGQANHSDCRKERDDLVDFLQDYQEKNANLLKKIKDLEASLAGFEKLKKQKTIKSRMRVDK